MDKCYICVKNILTHARKVTCCICQKIFHVKCISLSPEYMISIQDNSESWYCTYCIQTVFPFNNIEDDIDFLAEIEQSSSADKSLMYLSDKLLIPFELNDKDHSSILSETDPDLHYFNSFNQLGHNCNYFLQSKFNTLIQESNIASDVFSVCHINIRSLKKNLTEFESYLDMLSHKFTIIGFTETWLSDADSELYGPNGYHFIGKHRNSRGGGVAVCVQSHLHYFERPDISTIESDMETVFIEISKDQLQIDKNILIGVIYRPPATDVRSFNDKLNVYLDKIRKENKICYLLGDFNINLLNHDTHNLTGEFYDLMTSNSFLPLITRPTRVTATSATLIDNIFSNYLENCSHWMQGLMVTYISDHYPIFHVNRRVKA